MAAAIIGPKFYGWDDNGDPLAYGKLYTYEPGTNTPKPTYTNEVGLVENSNPVILNGSGWANVHLNGSYAMRLTDLNDNEIWTEDPVTDAPDQVNEWVNQKNAEYVTPSQFKVNGNQTDTFSIGRSVLVNDVVQKAGFVLSSVFLSGETFVEISIDEPLTTAVEWVRVGIFTEATFPQGAASLTSVESIAALTGINNPPAGKQVSVAGYYPGSLIGGGILRFTPSARHDGVTNFDPTRSAEIGTAAYYVDSGIDAPCWARVGSVIDFYQAGGVLDGVTDNSDVFDALKKLGRSFNIDEGDCAVSRTTNFPVGMFIYGQGRGTKIIPLASGTFTNGFIFTFNTVDQVNPDVPFPNMVAGGAINVAFSNDSQTANRRGFLYSGSFEFRNIRGRYMSQIIKSLAGGAYSDNSRITGIYGEPVLGSDYQIEVIGLGDGAEINGLQFPRNDANPGDTTANAVYLKNALGAVVSNVTGGNIKFENCVASLKDSHIEFGQVELVGAAFVSMKDTYLNPGFKVPVKCTNGTLQRGQLSLENTTFIRNYDTALWEGYDVELDSSFTLISKGSYRRHLLDTDLTTASQTGILVSNKAGSSITEFNDYSAALSQDGIISQNYKVNTPVRFESRGVSFNGLANIFNNSAVEWQGAATTYYYTSQLMLDATRKVGRNQISAERSRAVTTTGTTLQIDISTTPYSTVRIYRGTSPGVYDSYVDIPIISAALLVDNFDSLNGYPWIARGAAGVDTLNGIGDYAVNVNSDIAVVDAIAPPSVGTWKAGDHVRDRTPSAGGFFGWICVTAGTPGTWKTFGAISA